MSESEKREGALPPLKPRRRDDPFSRNMAAIVEAGSDTVGDPVAQAAGSPPAKRLPEPTAGPVETSRVHARIPTELMIELQVHCARNRTTMQNVIHELIAEFLARRAK